LTATTKNAGVQSMIKLLIAGNVMNVLDSVSTFLILKASPATINYEGNPLIRFFYQEYGSIILLFKILLMAVLTIWFYRKFSQKSPIHTAVGLSFVTIFFGFCVISNIASIFYL